MPITLFKSKGPIKTQRPRDLGHSLRKQQMKSDRRSNPSSTIYFGVTLGKLLNFLNFDFLMYKIGIKYPPDAVAATIK